MRVGVLLRKIWRDLLVRRYRVLAISLILASGMAIHAGIQSAVSSLFASRDHYYQQGNAADLELQFVPEDSANVPDFTDIPHLRQVERRMIARGVLEWKEKRVTTQLIALESPQQQKINRLKLLRGTPLDPAQPNQVLIDRGTATYLGIDLGSKLDVKVGKHLYEGLHVRGVVESPEHLLPAADPNLFVPSKGSAAVIFAPLELLTEKLGYKMLNSILFDLETTRDITSLTRQVSERADTKLSIEEILPIEQQYSYLYLKLDLDAFAAYVPSIVVVFAVTALVLILFLLSRWVRSQEREIGVLMALGYSSWRIASGYILAACLMAVGGILFGVPLSYATLAVFGISYADAIGMPPITLHLDPNMLATGALGVLLLCILSCILPCAQVFGMSPQQALRGGSDARERQLGRVGRALATRIGGALWLRYALRNLLRSRTVAVTTIAAVGLVLSVCISYLIAMRSFQETLIQRVGAGNWDFAAEFSLPAWEEELAPLKEGSALGTYEPFVRGSVRLSHHGRTKSAQVTSSAADRSLRSVALLEGKPLSQLGDGILVERQLARALEIRVGDTLHLEALAKNYDVQVVGIMTGTMPSEIVAPLESARRWFNMEEQATGVLVKLAPGVNPERVRELLVPAGVNRFTSKASIVQSLIDMLHEIMAILYAAEGFSLGVALLFSLTSLSFLLGERRSEMATLRSLGFEEKFLERVVLSETFALTLLASCLAIPVAWLIATWLMRSASEAWFTIETFALKQDFAAVLIPALALLSVAAIPFARKSGRAALASSLKERRFG